MKWGNVPSLMCNDPDSFLTFPPDLAVQCSAVACQGWMHSCIGDRGDKGKLSVDQSICPAPLS